MNIRSKVVTDDGWKHEQGERIVDVGTNIAGDPMQITVGYVQPCDSFLMNAITLDNDIVPAIAKLPEIVQSWIEMYSFLGDCCMTTMSSENPMDGSGDRTVGMVLEEAKVILDALTKQSVTIDKFRKSPKE